MGVIIKYQLEFKEPQLKVSNDLFKGEFIIDADITAEMMPGVLGSSFEITLYDLPEKKVNELVSNLTGKKTPGVTIRLGYFDGPFELVMEGIYLMVTSVASDDKLITTLKGIESGTYALLTTPVKGACKGEMKIAEVVKCLFENSQPDKEQIAEKVQLQEENISDTFKDPTLRSEKLMGALGELAKRVGAELLVFDKKAWIGKPIKNDTHGPVKLDRDANLALFKRSSKSIPDETDQNVLKPLPADEVRSFKFIITGDPKLRPAHKLVPKIDGFDESSGLEFRVHRVTHRFSATSGYVCEGVATRVGADGQVARQSQAADEGSAAGFAQGLIERIRGERRRSPVVEVGAVKTYAPEKHLATLNFGQRFERTETQPSARAEVHLDEQQVFHDKPIVSPFASHKCGLMVPVYPGMKALISHNLALLDDALVCGFIWSEEPKIEPPKNKEGDWWLCLPIDFDTSKPPTDNTKAANDLIANNGKRVIEVKGLKITIGANKLANVGTRPTEGADDEFLIEHKKAKIKIGADGNIEMTADSDGGVVFKITKSSIEIA
jgi:hypothetical protein